MLFLIALLSLMLRFEIARGRITFQIQPPSPTKKTQKKQNKNKNQPDTPNKMYYCMFFFSLRKNEIFLWQQNQSILPYIIHLIYICILFRKCLMKLTL